jgi:hypothetical protein
MVIVLDRSSFEQVKGVGTPSAPVVHVQAQATWNVRPIPGGPREPVVDLSLLGRSIVRQHGQALRLLAE